MRSSRPYAGDEGRSGPTIRPVVSRAELVAVFDALGSLIDPPFDHHDRRLEDLDRRFPEDAALMLLVADTLAPELRGRGLGRRLVERIEHEALELGVREICPGALDEARGFYLRLGYRGRRGMSKQLPSSAATPTGDERRRRLAELRARRAARSV
ncbi:MAG TPA: GNAT family N-acetyltransferase [Actinopolymorphaceae bacterium]